MITREEWEAMSADERWAEYNNAVRLFNRELEDVFRLDRENDRLMMELTDLSEFKRSIRAMLETGESFIEDIEKMEKAAADKVANRKGASERLQPRMKVLFYTDSESGRRHAEALGNPGLVVTVVGATNDRADIEWNDPELGAMATNVSTRFLFIPAVQRD